MSVSDEFSRLQVLHESGTLTDAEFTEAKTKDLADGQPPIAVQAVTVQQDIRRLQIQNEILQLDQNWATERENYMLRNKYGARSVPTKSNSINGSVCMCILFLVTAVLGASIAHEGPLTVIGVLGIVGSIWNGFWACSKADIYDAAYERYQLRRGEISAQLSRARKS